jgi:hypothetical protein
VSTQKGFQIGAASESGLHTYDDAARSGPRAYDLAELKLARLE